MSIQSSLNALQGPEREEFRAPPSPQRVNEVGAVAAQRLPPSTPPRQLKGPSQPQDTPTADIKHLTTASPCTHQLQAGKATLFTRMQISSINVPQAEEIKLQESFSALGSNLVAPNTIKFLAQIKEFYKNNKLNPIFLRNKITHEFLPGIERNILIVDGKLIYQLNRSTAFSDTKHSGTFGSVCFGIDIITGKPYAIKSILQDERKELWRKANCKHEYDIQAQFNDSEHVTHAVAYIDGNGKKGEKSYLIFEWMPQGSLGRYMSSPTFNPTEKTKIARDVAAGIKDLHDRGVLHRDLKFGNILIDQNGHAHLSDFGLACRVGDTARVKSQVGSPCYLSPALCTANHSETFKGSTETDDIWSFGILLYKMYAGTSPYLNTASAAELKVHIANLKEGWNDALSFPDTVSLEMQTLIRSMLIIDENNRPTITQVIEQLEAITPESSSTERKRNREESDSTNEEPPTRKPFKPSCS